jgi:very-short-patch-repair endonuclease
LVTRLQARQSGLTVKALRAALTRGELERVHGGVYRFASSRATWEQRALAALLRLGPSAALSHASAAFVLRLQGFSSRPDTIELTTARDGPRTKRIRPVMQGVLLHRTRVPFRTLDVGGLRVTSTTRTLQDLASRLEGDALEDTLDAAQHTFGLGERLQRAIEPAARGVKGTTRLRRLLEERQGAKTDSPLENRVFRALRRARLPRPVLQLEVFDGSEYVTRLDFAWPTERVALHVDGYAYHCRRTQFDHDRTVASKLTALGWRAVWVTSRTLQDPGWLTDLRAALTHGAPQLSLL